VTDYRVHARLERFTGKIFRLVTDEVAMPDGTVVNRDYLVHVGAVGVVALDDADRVLLVQQYRHPVGDRLWELPAGLMDMAGEDLVEAAARELAEEADLRAAQWELLVDTHTTPGCSSEVIRLFLARGLSPAGERHDRIEEEAELVARFVDLDDAVEMVFNGEITNGPCQVGVLAAARLRDRPRQAPRPLETPLPRHPLASVIATPPHPASAR
jgi:8-oxo-dGDP phosphatase